MERLPTRDAILARRRRLRRKYGRLYEQLAGMLFQHDPMHIAATRDEYEPEVERILPLIEQARSVDELTGVVHGVFREMFSPELAGPQKTYVPIAREIWKIAKRTAKVSA